MTTRAAGRRHRHGTTSDPCASCGTDDGGEWIKCDTCDAWYHYSCSGLHMDAINLLQNSDVKYLLFSCDLCHKKKPKPKSQKVDFATMKAEIEQSITASVENSLPKIVESALKDLSHKPTVSPPVRKETVLNRQLEVRIQGVPESSDKKTSFDQGS